MLRQRIQDLNSLDEGFKIYMRYGINLLSDMFRYYTDTRLEGKRKMLGLIFPEKLVFDGGTYLTTKENDFLTLLCSTSKDFKGLK